MTKRSNRKEAAAAYMADHPGVTYQQALQAIAARQERAEPARPAAALRQVDVDELVRLVLADAKAAGLTRTEEQARRDVAFTLGMLGRHLTSEPWTPGKPDQPPAVAGPHCQDDVCAWDVCQDGYAHHACRTPGCPICGAPPVSTPEHWACNVVAHAVMAPDDVARAEAHLKAHPLLRRPNDPPVLSDERYREMYPNRWDPEECDECGSWMPAGYSCNCRRDEDEW
ncbi:hypothetical protein ACGFJC_47665 [Nonomuraea fuscirosea]|uniref:hypothetical protein n=1 Tax=Nonomuraea fuscirosea TaxID=1291556 RepID=UPI00371B5378